MSLVCNSERASGAGVGVGGSGVGVGGSGVGVGGTDVGVGGTAVGVGGTGVGVGSTAVGVGSTVGVAQPQSSTNKLTTTVRILISPFLDILASHISCPFGQAKCCTSPRSLLQWHSKPRSYEEKLLWTSPLGATSPWLP